MTAPDPFALAVMVAYCGWDPTTEAINQTVTLDGNGTYLTYLPCLNVTAVTAVVITNLDGSTYTATVAPTAAADVGWSVNGVLTWLSSNNGGAWPFGPQSIAVTYSGGYGGAPDDLAAALASVSARMPIAGAVSQTAGPFGVTYAAPVAAGGLLLAEQMVFDKYRIPRVA